MGDVAFIGACFPNEILNMLIEKNMVADLPANIFGWKIVHSLSLNNVPLQVINEHKIPKDKWGEYPFMQEKVFTYDEIKFINYRYINKKIADKLSKAWFIFRELLRIKPGVVVVYCVHTPYLLPTVLYSMINRRVKIIQIVPDLPSFMSFNDKVVFKLLKNLDRFIQFGLLKRIDGWILLSKYMAVPLKISNKNYIVIEGICDEEESGVKPLLKKNFILYSGALTEQYGLPQLIAAFIESKIPCKLVFCGMGDYAEKIKEFSMQYNNIEYIGVLKRNELKSLQREAILLVNPRSAKEEYTKFSFPSKTMEYLASGTPVMMERLPGIPEEYFDYIIEVKNADWTTSLRDFYYSSNDAKETIGQRGKMFVVTKKNALKQGELIKRYIEGITKNDFI